MNEETTVVTPDQLYDPKTFASTFGAEMGMKYTTALNLFKTNKVEDGGFAFQIGDRWYAWKSQIDTWMKR